MMTLSTGNTSHSPATSMAKPRFEAPTRSVSRPEAGAPKPKVRNDAFAFRKYWFSISMICWFSADKKMELKTRILDSLGDYKEYDCPHFGSSKFMETPI